MNKIHRLLVYLQEILLQVLTDIGEEYQRRKIDNVEQRTRNMWF